MSAMQDLAPAIKRLANSYQQTTSISLKFIDIYLVFIMGSGILQFVYMLAAGTFPYNAFLAGFISSVGSFVLAGEFISVFVLYLSPKFAYSDIADYGQVV
ncbi:hypothetical protein INT44_008841 [Umbelopsis vinacea]|uniref:Dolichyl-diphosphooligosaccharide--protein glycosyltransferase subunit OST2 n=1 Tax=Umbelopsis vinacea TaxID=44442 RepID=A0A8H7UI13_9FUNG|nr:hypothetical protein INT44_008841 [Umbelopsis vinacea]